MRKQKIGLVLCVLCLTPLAFAEVPVVDYSVESAAEGSAPSVVAGSNAAVVPAQAAEPAQPSRDYNEIPSEQVAKASITQQGVSPKIAQSSQNQDTNSSATAAVVVPSADTSNMSTPQRIKRLEQQVDYLNAARATIDDLQQKLQKAQGDVEVQQHKTEQLEKQLNDFYTDLDGRISKTKGSVKTKNDNAASDASVGSKSENDVSDVSTDTTPKPASKKKTGLSTNAIAAKKSTNAANAKGHLKAETKVANEGMDKSSVEVDSSSVEVDSSSTDSDTAAVNPAKTVGKKGATVQEQQAYQAAFDSLQNKQYSTAAKGLKGYLAKYPDGVYVGNAHYWLGEIYFQGSSYAKASTEFDTVVSTYASSSKVPEAMFKLAYIHDKEGKHAQASSEYNDLKKRFPKSGAAKLAAEQLAVKN